ncbi:MAG: RnfABCDGE type electron transport complex subunit G [Marinifilaceae bacterium]|nr:RnfABCDGE type electron transport complex subunit G [Marinifilaceae bacterium]
MGKKVESSFVNMVVVLFTITLIAAAAVGYVFTLTESTIAQANAQKESDAIKNVIPVEFADITSEKVAVGADTVEVFYAKNGNQIVGTAVKSFTNSGFNGYISIMVGFDTKGTITGYSVLSQGETPGLGSKMVDWFTESGKGNIIGKNPGDKGISVKKDGGEIDAITAATISSRAFCDAVNRAAQALGGVSAWSGATPTNEQSVESENNEQVEPVKE